MALADSERDCFKWNVRGAARVSIFLGVMGLPWNRSTPTAWRKPGRSVGMLPSVELGHEHQTRSRRLGAAVILAVIFGHMHRVPDHHYTHSMILIRAV